MMGRAGGKRLRRRQRGGPGRITQGNEQPACPHACTLVIAYFPATLPPSLRFQPMSDVSQGGRSE